MIPRMSPPAKLFGVGQISPFHIDIRGILGQIPLAETVDKDLIKDGFPHPVHRLNRSFG